MFCENCGNEVNENAVVCLSCGCQTNIQKNNNTLTNNQKDKFVYILLGLFGGCIGIHNFYAGHDSKAKIQLILGLTVIGCFVTGIWTIIDILTETKDGNGVPFK